MLFLNLPIDYRGKKGKKKKKKSLVRCSQLPICILYILAHSVKLPFVKFCENPISLLVLQISQINHRRLHLLSKSFTLIVPTIYFEGPNHS